MKMPAAKSQQANGFSRKVNGLDCIESDDRFRTKLINKKLDMMEQENVRQGQQKAEEFYDTSDQGAHSSHRQTNNQGDEPILIYDTQNNTSIAQTAKDQFAVALLRLQEGLDNSASRLNAIESKVDDLVRQQRQNRHATSSESANKKSSWLAANKSHLNTIIYLSWPVLVFVVMRALEKRALLKKLA